MRYQKAIKSTLFISLTTALASVLGFGQQSLIAFVFGAGREVDAYVASQTIPDIFTKILQGGILSIVFVPIFVKLICRKQTKKAWQITTNLISIVGLVFSIVIIIGIIITPLLVKLIVPGFEATGQALTIKLTRLFFPAVLLNLLTVLGISTLHAFKKFNLPSLIKLILPLTVIPLLLIFKNSLGVELLAWGNLVASILQVVLIVQAMMALGFRFSLRLNLKDPVLKKMLILVSPFIFATVFSQASSIVDKILASHLAEGSISALFFSNKIFRFVSGIFLTALPIVSFPAFSEFVAKKQFNDLVASTRTIVRLIAFITLPATAGLIILSLPVTQALFQRGNFTNLNSRMTAIALMFYALGLVFNGINHIWGNIFYALEKTKILVKISILVVSANIILNLILVKPLSHGGIALATTLSYLISFILHFGYLQIQIKEIKKVIFDWYYLKIILSTVLMSFIIMILWPIAGKIIKGNDLSLQIIRLFVIISLGTIVYFYLNLKLKTTEAKTIIEIIKHYLNRNILKNSKKQLYAILRH